MNSNVELIGFDHHRYFNVINYQGSKLIALKIIKIRAQTSL